MRRELVLEWADTVATVALLPVMWWEATNDGASSPAVVAANVVIFVVLAGVFVLRVTSGEWARMGRVERVVEIVLLAAAVPVAIGSVSALRLLRMLRLPLLGVRSLRALRARLLDHGPSVVIVTTLLTVAVATIFVLEAEADHPDASIRSTPDAVWWVFTTMTTVGYGDLSPRTGWGRVIAVALMFIGVTLFGLVTALMAKWLVGNGPTGDEA